MAQWKNCIWAIGHSFSWAPLPLNEDCWKGIKASSHRNAGPRCQLPTSSYSTVKRFNIASCFCQLSLGNLCQAHGTLKCNISVSLGDFRILIAWDPSRVDGYDWYDASAFHFGGTPAYTYRLGKVGPYYWHIRKFPPKPCASNWF